MRRWRQQQQQVQWLKVYNQGERENERDRNMQSLVCCSGTCSQKFAAGECAGEWVGEPMTKQRTRQRGKLIKY